ncbi:shikimate dehydrogenase family protein [Sorangium cellulosum]|uniref:Shikimate dehydrogenase (NADP(+)) n=1 Tax=Sorangium cellulosum TaxID=56 RepID=A0A150Q7G8_SORCE|nr:shikimate dehydrogenase [Sorangium cellulosum]KYF63935.1 shikimate dehydrogenase [Sorangium cellulosum]
MSNPERRMFGLVGHPVGHSVSPAMHSAAFRAHQLPHIYSAFDVPTGAELARFVSDIRSGLIAGANVTIPHKRAIMSMVDDIDSSAAEVGVANVLCATESRRVTAHNTDVLALRDELAQLLGSAPPGGDDPAGRHGALTSPRQRAVIIGAGGAAFAAIEACKMLGYHLISVTTRSWTSTEAMLESPAGQRASELGALTAPWPIPTERSISSKSSVALRLNWSEFAVAADLIIQATSAGMLGGPPGEEVTSIIPWDSLSRDVCLYDVVYNPPVTPFLRIARERGLRASDGLGMLVGQAAQSFTLWTGLPAPVDAMRAAAEDSLRKATGGR